MINRRNLIKGMPSVLGSSTVLSLLNGCSESAESLVNSNSEPKNPKLLSMKIYYLEIVTPDVDAAVALCIQIHGATFADPNPIFGGARITKLDGGELLGIRAPMRETETPVVRPYYLVDNIDNAVESASNAGAEVAMGPTEMPGYGKFAIFVQGGIETGLWQSA